MYRLQGGNQAAANPLQMMEELKHDFNNNIENTIERSNNISAPVVFEHLTDTLVQLVTQNKDIPGYKILKALKQMIWTNPILSRIMFVSNIIAGVYLTYILYKGLRGFVFYGIKSFRKYKKEAIKKYNSYQMGGGGWISSWISRLWPREPHPIEIYMEDIEEGDENSRVTDPFLDQKTDFLSEVHISSDFSTTETNQTSEMNQTNEIQQCSLSDIPFMDGIYQDSRLV